MESTAALPLSDVINGPEINADYQRRIRVDALSRNEFREELEALIPELTDAVRLGVAYDLLGDRDAAVAALRKEPDNPWAVFVLGRMLIDEGRHAEAAKVLEPAWKSHGTDELGPLLVEARALGNDTEGARTLLGTLGLADTDARARYVAGVIAEREGEYAEALECYEQATELHPEETIYHFRLGYLHALHGDEDRAIKAYEMCQRTTPVFARAMINLGILYEDQEQFDDAETCYRMVLTSNPDHARAKLYLADVEASQNMYYDREKEKEKTRRNQILQIPVTDFELSVRSRNCLAKMNIHTLGDLIRKTEAELLSYKNFGETSLTEIKKILAQKGFRLGQGIEDKPTPRQLPDSEQAKVLGEPVSVLDLSSRAQRCMDRLGIESLHDLVKRTELELISQKNFGMTSLNELKTKLKERGLSLASG